MLQIAAIVQIGVTIRVTPRKSPTGQIDGIECHQLPRLMVSVGGSWLPGHDWTIQTDTIFHCTNTAECCRILTVFLFVILLL